jgi:hypothetical protein
MASGPAAQVAQLVEHATENRSVGGSIPPLGTMCSMIRQRFGHLYPLFEKVTATAKRKGSRPRCRTLLPIIVAGTVLPGCTAGGRPSNEYLAEYGYWYHDANHEGGWGGAASPQAVYNATHGTWLWPPAEVDIPN